MDLGRRDAASAGGALRRNRLQPAARRCRPRHRCGSVDDGGADLRRVSRGGGRLAHVCQRPVPRSVCRGPCAPRDDGAAGAHAAHCHASSRWRAGGGRHRGSRGWRPAADPSRRHRAGRRDYRQGRRRARRIGTDRRIAAGAAAQGPASDERLHQCRRRVRPFRHPARGREHLCRHRAPGRTGASARGRRCRGSPTATP